MRKRILCFLMTFALALQIVPTQVSAKSKIKLNKTYITLPKNKTYTLKVKGTKRKIKWSSSKKKIASVTKKGKVTAKKSGTTYIIAKVGKKKYKCKISVKSSAYIRNRLSDAYNWQCDNIWNEGFCDIYHFIEDGTDALGNKMNIMSTIKKINKAYKKRASFNKFVSSIQGKKYSKFKAKWTNLDKQTVRLKNILDKNGAPKPKSNYYFPYQKYSNYLWDLLEIVNRL